MRREEKNKERKVQFHVCRKIIVDEEGLGEERGETGRGGKYCSMFADTKLWMKRG